MADVKHAAWCRAWLDGIESIDRQLMKQKKVIVRAIQRESFILARIDSRSIITNWRDCKSRHGCTLQLAFLYTKEAWKFIKMAKTNLLVELTWNRPFLGGGGRGREAGRKRINLKEKKMRGGERRESPLMKFDSITIWDIRANISMRDLISQLIMRNDLRRRILNKFNSKNYAAQNF